jgi:hypothetical protein
MTIGASVGRPPRTRMARRGADSVRRLMRSDVVLYTLDTEARTPT